MPRRVLKIVCAVSGVLSAVIGAYIAAAAVWVFQTVGNTGSTGMIGGAGAPTFLFLLQRAAGTHAWYLAFFFLFLFTGTGLALIFSGKSKR